MTDAWGGAQWVLVTFWVITFSIRLAAAVYAVKVRRFSVENDGADIVRRAADIGCLAAVLWWGGFWS